MTLFAVGTPPLSQLPDVDLENLTPGDFLEWDGLAWFNVPGSSIVAGYVPYTGATANVDLGSYDLTAANLSAYSQFSQSTVSATYAPSGIINSKISMIALDSEAYLGTLSNTDTIFMWGGPEIARLTSTGFAVTGTNSLFVGSSAQFTVNSSGVVTAGTWQGGTVGIPYGGTNTTNQTANGITFFDGTKITSDAYLKYTPANSRFSLQRASEPGSLYFIDLGSGYTQFITSYGSVCTKTTFCNNVSIQEDFQLASTSVGASIILAPTLMTIGTTSATDLRFIRGSTERLRLNASGALIPSSQNLTVGLAASGTKKFTVSDTTAALNDVIQIQGNYAADGYGSAITFTDATPTTLCRINSLRESNNNIGLSASVFSSGALRTAWLASSDGGFRTFGTAGSLAFYANSGEHLFYTAGTPYMRFVQAFNDAYLQTYTSNSSLFLTGAAGATMAVCKIAATTTYITGVLGVGSTAAPLTAMTLSLATNNDGFSINQTTASKQAYISFLDNGTVKWIIGKQTTNGFFMYDAANARDFLQVAGGVLYLQPGSGYVCFGNVGLTSSTAKLQITGNVEYAWDAVTHYVRYQPAPTSYYGGWDWDASGRDLSLVAVGADGDPSIYFKTGTAATTRMQVNASGQVIIGAIGSSAAKVTITSDAVYNSGVYQLQLQGASNNNKQMLLLFDTSSDVGIIQPAIAGSSYKNLHLNPSAANVGIGVPVGTTVSTTLQVLNQANSAVYNEVTNLGVTNNAGGTNFSLFRFGQVTTNNMFIEVANQSNVKGTLNLQPYGGSVFACDATSTGRFGVGVNPVAKFQVNAGVGAPTNYANYGILMYDGGSAAGSYGLGISGSTIWQNSASFHAWYTAGTEQMRLWFGNLGVNSTAPLGRLTICGGTADNHSIELGYSGGLTANYMESINRNGGASVDFVYYMGGATLHRFYTSNLQRCYVGAGFVVGAPTGGDVGAGFINVSGGIRLNNTAYTNPHYVFEHFFMGKIVKYANNNGAADYKGLMPLDDLREYVKEHHHFPVIKDKPTCIFERADIGLQLQEEAHLYIFELHDRIRALEKKLAV